MKTNFTRALAALDLSSMDLEIIRYLSETHVALGIKEIYFVHIMPDFTNPTREDSRFKQVFNPDKPVDEMIRARIKKQVDEHLEGAGDLKWSIEVIEGKPYQKLIHWLEVKDVDLLVTGKKPASEGSGITAKRVARSAECNVLFVSPRGRGKWRNVTVPLDFSAFSATAAKLALALKVKDPDLVVHGLYIVEMPLEDYYNTTGLYSGYRPVLMEAAKSTYDTFIRENGFDPGQIQMEFVSNDYGNVSGHIAEHVRENPTDLLVIGAQGHSALERFLYGSVTEKLLDKINGVPILIVRS